MGSPFDNRFYREKESRTLDTLQLAAKIAEQIAPAIQQQTGTTPIVIIGRIDVRVNYASGGGATINVRGERS